MRASSWSEKGLQDEIYMMLKKLYSQSVQMGA